MQKVRKIAGSYLAVIAAMVACTQAASASPLNPKVLVMVAPLTAYVNTITGSAADAQSLLKPGQDPHHFAMAPSQAEALAHAEILIVPDLAMNPVVANLASRNKNLHVIELSLLDGAEPLPYAADNPWVAAVKKAGNEKDDDDDVQAAKKPKGKTPHKEWPDTKPSAITVDPHFWLDPERMAAIALPLADAIAQYLPPGQKVNLETNARAEAKHLRQEAIPAMHELLTAPHTRYINANYSKTDIPFITYHAAYQYFLGRFGIARQGEITARPEDYLGAKSLDGLLASAKQVRIRCIIGEAQTPIVQRIASLSGASVVVLSPEQNVTRDDVPSAISWVHDDYDRLLYKTAKAFGDCL